MRFYKNMNGDNWQRISGQWDKNTQIETWHGITTNAYGRVIGIDLRSKGLQGKGLSVLGLLGKLEKLRINNNKISGRLPMTLVLCRNITMISCKNTNMKGRIPFVYNGMLNLKHLWVKYNTNIRGSYPFIQSLSWTPVVSQL